MSPKILLVDDDPAMLRMLERRLCTAGYHVLTASSGELAVRLALTEKPSIVITDWSMPEMDGLELCRVLRSLEGIHFTYIIMLTAHDEEERMVDAFDAGADDFLHKPVSSDALLARLKAAMRIVQLESSLDQQNRNMRQVNAELIHLNRKLEDLARTDALTGLFNRREAMHRLHALWPQDQAGPGDLSCMLLDLDHFKSLNDRFGHDFGDEALKVAAATLRRVVRPVDTVCRVGGEEFLVLCPAQDLAATVRAAEEICAQLRAVPVTHGGQETTLTTSIGAAAYEPTMTSPEDLLQQADHALYVAKRVGRNQVRAASAWAGAPATAADGETLPVTTPAREETTNAASVLLVDDDASIRMLCRRFLETGGYTVVEARDGLEAAEKARQHRFDVIVMDRMMPRLDGIECTRRLKADETTRDIPIIMASASGEEEDIIAGLEAGADEYIQKPVRRREFVLRVGSMAKLYRSKLRLIQACETRDEQARALTMLLEFSAVLSVTQNLEVALEKTISVTARLLRSRQVSIMLPDAEGRYLSVARSIGLPTDVVAGVRIPRGEGIAGHVFDNALPLVINDADSSLPDGSRYAGSIYASLPLVSHPLVGPDHVIGVLNVTGREHDHPFQPRELKYIQLITSIAAATFDDILNRRARDEARDSIVGALATLVEYRDTDTRRHMDRVTSYGVVLAEELRRSGRFSEIITDAFLHDLQRAVPLHDIGKVGVPDCILLKPGKLNADEMGRMRQHAQIGASAIRSVMERVPGVRFLKMAEEIACSHHECYDGSGYPHRLKGEEIPLSARLTALADVYDAVTTRRVYKEALSHETAVEIIRQAAGTQFDPYVVEAFLRREGDFRRIARELADEPLIAPPRGGRECVATAATRWDAGSPAEPAPPAVTTALN